MSPRPLISDSEKDKHKARDQLLKELSELRAQLAAKTEDLAGSERVFVMLDGITEPVLVLDDASQVVYANSAAALLFAKDPGAIEGRSLWDLYPKSHDTLFYNAYEKARKTRGTGKFRDQHRLLGKWFEVCLYPAQGGMTVVFNDITVSRQMEELPRLALSLLHNLKDNVFLIRADGRMFHVNNQTKDSLGYTSDELHKMSILDVVPSDCQQAWRGILDRIRQHGSMTFESRLRARDGREFPVEVLASFIELYGQSYYTVSARDITERKRVEDALMAAEDFNRSVLDSLPSNIAVVDEAGKIIYVNEAWKKFAGDNEADTGEVGVGINYFDVCRNVSGSHAEEAPAALDGMISVMAGGTDLFEMEYPCHSPDVLRWFQMRVTPFLGRKKHGIVVYHNDITARKLVEEALRESEMELARAQQISHIGSWTWDLITDELTWSDESYRNYGLVPGEVKASYDLFLSFIVPEDRERVDKTVLRAIDAGEKYNVIYKIIRKDGTLRVLLSENEIITGGSGKVIKMYGTNQDITERKQAEEALMVAKAQAELYVDLMGHDINNMNQVAMASLELALMDLEQGGTLDAAGIPLLETSMESLASSSQLIKNVQKLQRASMEGIKLQPVDVACVLKGIIDEQRSTPGKDVTIYYKNQATHCLVTADELLRDVFTNLISNAIKHSGPEKHLTIGVTVDSVERDGKKFCRVAIEDNGPGIPDATKEKLFSRFARGATKARGSGLGLYLVRTLVQHYGGDIRVEDRVPGDYTKGARFVVTIASSDS